MINKKCFFINNKGVHRGKCSSRSNNYHDPLVVITVLGIQRYLSQLYKNIQISVIIFGDKVTHAAATTTICCLWSELRRMPYFT